MNFEQILELLGAKFQGVRKDGLAQLARVMALQCSNEDEAKALVEKVTEAQVTDFVKEYRKVVDAEVSNAGKNIEASLRKKMEAEAGKPKVNEATRSDRPRRSYQGGCGKRCTASAR